MNAFFLLVAIHIAAGILLRQIWGGSLFIILFIFILALKKRWILIVAIPMILGWILSGRTDVSGEVLGKAVSTTGRGVVVRDLRIWNGKKWKKLTGSMYAEGVKVGNRVYCEDIGRRSGYPEYVGIRCSDFPLDSSILDEIRRFTWNLREVLNGRSISVDMVLGMKPAWAKRLGLHHLFAVSGFHVGVFYWLTGLILSPLLLDLRLRLPISLVLTLIYTSMSGFPPSAMRAFFMLSIWSFFKILDYPVSPLNVLGLSATISLLLDPFLTLSPAFLMSHAAALGVMIALERDLPGIFVPIFAYLFTLPISVIFFGNVNPISLPLSLVLSPLASGMTVIGSVAAGLHMVKLDRLGSMVIDGLHFLEKPLVVIMENLGKIADVSLPAPWSFVLSLVAIWLIGTTLKASSRISSKNTV